MQLPDQPNIRLLTTAELTSWICLAFHDSLYLHSNNKGNWATSVIFLLVKLNINKEQHYIKHLSKIVNLLKWTERLNAYKNEERAAN